MNSTSASILVVDDEQGIRRTLTGILEDEEYVVYQAENGDAALKVVQEDGPDLVILDIWMPGRDGMAVLQEIRDIAPQLPVVMISGHGSIELAVRATKLGAYDFIEKPLSLNKVILTIQNALNYARLHEENLRLRQQVSPRDEVTGIGAAIAHLREQIRIIAPTSSWILIHGENGTGKEVVARSIYRHMGKPQCPFVEVNCAAIPADLIESELFGHERGAFTGATQMRRGKFDLADGGILFLDEIGDMSLSTQAKILRVLQEQAFQRVGGTKTIHVRVRVIAATNKDLEAEIRGGRFREDLYHRINVIPMEIPPLRERKEDIPLLVDEFAEEFCQRHGHPKKTFAPDVIQAFSEYDWPGNVRELKHMVERLMILSRSNRIGKEDLMPPLQPALSTSSPTQPQNLKEAREEFERVFIEEQLRASGGNITKTAEGIGIERSHLYRKIKDLGIQIPKT